MKKLAVFMLSIFLFSLCGCAAPVSEPGDYTQIEESFLSLMETALGQKVQIYDTDDLTAQVLEARQDSDTILIERCIGKVLNSQTGDGIVLNTADDFYNYISYASLGWELEVGDFILTYAVYNPNSNYVDDIIERYDFVLKRK